MFSDKDISQIINAWIGLIIILGIITLITTILWLVRIVQLANNGNTAGSLLVFIIGILLTPFIGIIFGLFFKKKSSIRELKEKELALKVELLKSNIARNQVKN